MASAIAWSAAWCARTWSSLMHSVSFWYVLLLRLSQALCETCANAALVNTMAANATATMTKP